MSLLEVPVGRGRWSLDVPDGCLVTLERRVLPGASVQDPRAAVRDAMEHPLRLGFPFRRALTPDDRITLVVDERLPHLSELIAGVLEYLLSAGIGPGAVTILAAPDGPQSSWIDELPDEFADVHTEVHQPNDRKLLAYLATTKSGRRVYLNRTLVDAEQVVSISGRRYDSLLGYGGCEGILYPALGDKEARHALGSQRTLADPSIEPDGVRAESIEIANLLGATFFVQVVEGPGDEIAHVVAGFHDSTGDGIRLLDERWRFGLLEPVDVVLATISGEHARHDFTTLANAVAAASRAVKQDGIVVLLSEAESEFGPGMEMVRRCEDCRSALKLLFEHEPPDMGAAFQWITAASRCRIYLASGLRPDVVEEIFATPILSPTEVQRLLDLGGSCLYLPDADKSFVAVGAPATKARN